MVLSSREEPVIIYYLGDGKEGGGWRIFQGASHCFQGEHGGGNRHPQSIEVGLDKIDCQ